MESSATKPASQAGSILDHLTAPCAPVREVYYVATDVILPSGAKMCNCMLSREIKHIGVLRRVHKRVQRRVPQAVMVHAMQFR